METNVQRLASKVEIDFEWELLTVIKQKWINIYWRQVEHVIAAKANVNFCWNSKEDCWGGGGGGGGGGGKWAQYLFSLYHVNLAIYTALHFRRNSYFFNDSVYSATFWYKMKMEKLTMCCFVCFPVFNLIQLPSLLSLLP